MGHDDRAIRRTSATPRLPALLPLLCLSAAAAACSSRTVYDTLRATQRNQCWQYLDSQRERCLEAADVDYDTYARGK